MRIIKNGLIIILFVILISCKPNIIGEFKNHKTINIKEMENISIPIFGIESTNDIPSTTEKTISFDEMSGIIFLINFEEPKNSFILKLTDPQNKTYERKYLKSENSYYTLTENHMSGEKYPKPVYYFTFNNFSYFINGKWKVKVITDDNTKNIFEKTLNIEMKDITIIKKRNKINNPLTNIENERQFSSNDEIVIYGYFKEKNKKFKLGLYCFTNNMNEKNETILKPVIGTIIKTDGEGKFNITFKFGTNYPNGENYVVTGNEEMRAHLFTGYFGKN